MWNRELNMIYPPGQGQSGQHLMQLWRDYLEQYADREGDAEGQAIVAAYNAVEALACLSRTIDKNDRYKNLIDQRIALFHEGRGRADNLFDCLINATFSIYNSFNTLSHQLTEGNAEAAALIQDVDAQVHQSAKSADPVERSAAALRASFPLLGLVTIALDHDQAMIRVIRQVEKRFADAAIVASSGWEHLFNALYRIVEMMQIFALLTDSELKDQINQVAARFQEEDQARELRFKLRNGFCRLFELVHLLAIQFDAML
jgi:hypothetical protein